MSKTSEIFSSRRSLAFLHTAKGEYRLKIKVARSFLTRFAGLMLRKPMEHEHGFLLTRCPSVHTMFMRCPIDVIYLDSAGTVIKCVPGLKPWRGSFSNIGKDQNGHSYPRAEHTLEMAEGSIARFGIRSGDVLRHDIFGKAEQCPRIDKDHPEEIKAHSDVAPTGIWRRQRGAAMVEFVVVGPVITLLGLSALQYGMLFFAKNQINHAAFIAARAGSMGNARISTVRNAYAKAMIPLYGGGQNSEELAEAYARAQADLAVNMKVVVLNPTKESFDDFNDQSLEKKYGSRAIPNGGLAYKDHTKVEPNSGQTIDDANVLKLKIVHGYAPKVPIVASLYTKYLQLQDPGNDAFYTQMVNTGRIPVETTITMQMQSDAIEDENASSPGQGNGGNPPDSDDPPLDPPDDNVCTTLDCSTENPPYTPGGSVTPGENGQGCPKGGTTFTMESDIGFAFDSATLTAQGKQELDELIEQAKTVAKIDSITIIGYTDQIGSDSYNKDLSLRRAMAVRDYIQSNGLNVQISVLGAGASNPRVDINACPGTTEQKKACLAPNRRVEITAYW